MSKKTREKVLREITKANSSEGVASQVSDDQQKNVAGSLYSTAEAKVNWLLAPLAIYAWNILGDKLTDEEAIIGFVMYGIRSGVGLIMRLINCSEFQMCFNGLHLALVFFKR